MDHLKARGSYISQVNAAISRTRRTQTERTEETRAALIEAAITVLHRHGYNAATNGAIADEAGVSRGSIIYQFGTRAQLLAEVITFVFEKEQRQYQALQGQGLDMSKTEDWPEMLWRVFSEPSGLAVIEILQAARSDRELAELVVPTQERIEQLSIETLLERFPGNEKQLRVRVRLFVWAIRGLELSRVLSRDPTETEEAVKLFRDMVRASVDAGLFRVST